jgi:mannose-6-phosphate isomerase-like protein (cupin superfamily)
MSYPPPRYVGEGGEVTAVFRAADQGPDLISRTGSVRYLATGASTGGDFGLYRWDMGPQPSGAGPHFHRTMSESFFVLSGVVRVTDGPRTFDATFGDFLHVPMGGIHGFRNESGHEASMLILFVPGAPREKYFETLARWSLDGYQPTDQESAELFEQHDNHYI